jgi:hypothetical protein
MEKGLIKYFAVFIYGMFMLITLSNKEKDITSVSSNGFKTKAYKNSTTIKEKTVTAQRFFSSNERFTIRFSDNEFSFLY